MTDIISKSKYDLEDRTASFAHQVHNYCLQLPRQVVNFEVAKQLIRSSGSIGANYIEANESFSRKDCILRIKICRKESKESRYWLNLSRPSESIAISRIRLIQEARELTHIFGSIVCKMEQSEKPK